MSEPQEDVTGTKVKDESQDQKYFTITPRLIWALARNPYDYTLWATIKGIAGESGECFLATDELASLAMMSVGQAHESRKYWIEIKMLFGEIRKDPGYQQSVWHLRIPNIWAANIEWATRFSSLKDRVKFKREQAEDLREMRKKAREEAKNAEKSLHPVKASPGEGIHSPGEPEHSPGELKNIHKKNHKEDLAATAAEDHQRGMTNPNSGNRTDAVVHGDPMDGLLFGARMAAEQGNQLVSRVQEYPQDCQQTLTWFVEVFGWPVGSIPSRPIRGGKGGAYAQWINELRDVNQVIEGFGKAAIQAVKGPCAELSISHPAAVMWALPAEVGKLAQRKQQKAAQRIDTPFTRSLAGTAAFSPASQASLEAARAKIRSRIAPKQKVD